MFEPGDAAAHHTCTGVDLRALRSLPILLSPTTGPLETS